MKEFIDIIDIIEDKWTLGPDVKTKVKSRLSGDRRKLQGETSSKVKASPTAVRESVIIIKAIDAEEERDIAVDDLPCFFMLRWMT